MASPGEDPRLRGVRILRLVGVADLVIGIALLIAGFATDTTIVWVVGAFFAASAGTLFVLTRTLSAQQAREQDRLPGSGL